MELMALKIVHSATSPCCNNFHPFFKSKKIMKIDRALSATRLNSSFCRSFTGTVYLAKATEQGFEETTADSDYNSTFIKESLYDAVQGINRGIFGVQSERKAEIEKWVKQLESKNPTPEPTKHVDKMGGKWKLVYSTITILGAKRTKLGLRDFITLGDFLQTIDISQAARNNTLLAVQTLFYSINYLNSEFSTQGKAVNVIEFSARGLNLLKGHLRIEATFKIASETRVDISYDSSSITPDQLMNVFKKNYELLLRIFNPEGWLDITYLDDTLRIGRDDKGNIFVLERSN